MRQSFLPFSLALSLIACSSTTEPAPAPAEDGGAPPSTNLDGGPADGGNEPADAGADGGDGGDGGPIACAWGTDVCPEGTYCAASDCGKGVCVPKGVTEEPVKAVVCGCDGVNYWNRSLAAVHGIAVRGEGACGAEDGISCGGHTPTPKECPETARCVAVRDSDDICLLPDAPGECWTAPSDCTATTSRAKSCEGLSGGGSEVACASECQLLKDAYKVVRSADCE